MIKPITYLALGCLATTGLLAKYVFFDTKSERVNESIAAEMECDSCSARKQNLKRVQEALNPAVDEQD